MAAAVAAAVAEGWDWREGQKRPRGEATRGKEQGSDRMHERRETTAEQLQEKDKRAVKCQGYLIH